MVPLVPDNLPNLYNKNILLVAGLSDPIVSREQTQNLYNLFHKTGANVQLKWQHSSHNLVPDDIVYAKEWLIKIVRDKFL